MTNDENNVDQSPVETPAGGDVTAPAVESDVPATADDSAAATETPQAEAEAPAEGEAPSAA